jgi:DNA primase
MTPQFRDWIEKAKAVGIGTILRQRGIKLKGHGGKLAGPCPHCGGEDRFGVTLAKDAFHCRGCGAGGYGAISLVRFLDGSNFLHAVETITGEPQPKDNGARKQTRHKPAEQLGPIVAEYDYTDELDQVLFQTVRYAEPKKTFRQRRPDPNRPGDWIWGTEGVRLVPFKLPDLIEAIAYQHTVYVLEGEKDVLTAMALGLAATTNPMGAGKWRAAYNEHFHGADIVVVPDNDKDPKKGRAHADNVARHLRKVAERVRILTLPGEAKDLTEWVEAGGTCEQLQALTNAAPEYIARAEQNAERVPDGADSCTRSRGKQATPRPRLRS